jgi:hypothetical protein
MKPVIRRSIATLVAASMLALSLPAPVMARDAPTDVARHRVELLLVEHGVDAREARARVTALTDEEAVRVAAEFHKLPTGGMDPVTLGYLFVIVAGGALLIVALPFILLVKVIKAGQRSGVADAAQEDANPAANGRHAEPRY